MLQNNGVSGFIRTLSIPEKPRSLKPSSILMKVINYHEWSIGPGSLFLVSQDPIKFMSHSMYSTFT